MGTYEDFFKALEVQKRTERRWFCFDAGEYTVHVMLDPGSSVRTRLEEAKGKGKHLGGEYYAHIHPAHTPEGQKHVHVYGRSGKLFAINKDGSAHDKSHQYQIPSVAADGLRKLLPDFEVPADNFIEALDLDLSQRLLAD